MENKALFRTAFQGFKKEDVVEYIDRLNRDANRMIADKDGRIKQLEADISQSNDEAKKLAEQCEDISKRLQQAEEAVKQRDAQLEQLKNRASDEQKQPEGVSAQQYEQVTGQCEQLKRRCEQLENEKQALQKQLDTYREFDGVQRDLGTIMIKAEKNAADIVASAKKESDDILSETSRSCDAMVERRKAMCARIAEVYDGQKSALEQVHAQLSEKIADMNRAVAAFYEALENGSKTVHDGVDAVVSIKNQDTAPKP